MTDSELTLSYLNADHIGYGRMGRYLADELTKMGIALYAGPDLNIPQIVTSTAKRTKQTNVVCCMSYPSHLRGYWEGQHKVCLTMWEATVLPEAFRDTLHNFETVIVPSQQNLELFSAVHDNVKLMMLGIDNERWAYRERPQPGQFFDFLIGGGGPRKGIDLAVDAFNKVFGDFAWQQKSGPIPRLIIKAPKPQDVMGDRIEQINGFLSPEEEVELYARCHVYLQPARGEGFGLQPLQAIAQGMPTILTNAHGHAAFAHLGFGLSTELTKAAYFMLGDAGEWWEPNLTELCGWMEYLYENYDKEVERAKTSSQLAHRDFTWKKAAQQFVDAIGRDELTKRYSGTGEWVEPNVRLFRTVLLRDYKAAIGDHSYQWIKGQEYYEPADVRRILFESNLLDPSCVSADDPGMSADDVEKYSARHAYCSECQQLLGSGVTRADELMAN